MPVQRQITVRVQEAAARPRGRRGATVAFRPITAMFTDTLVDNVIERPDGVKIASSS